VPKDTASIAVSSTGVVTAKGVSGAGTDQELGRIELARFANPSGLEAMGQNLFSETTASGDPIKGMPTDQGMGRIAQGYLESSNVEVVQEMVDMITAMRAYEINSKAIKNSEDMAQVANSLMR
ncbi:MAG TPA: flagellar hook-basal body complex protein, partial [Candidatus Elarobacter sp.]|nr:flagellar hook-basal body complex protein [Candidatus Elarobacter sp.]